MNCELNKLIASVSAEISTESANLAIRQLKQASLGELEKKNPIVDAPGSAPIHEAIGISKKLIKIILSTEGANSLELLDDKQRGHYIDHLFE